MLLQTTQHAKVRINITALFILNPKLHNYLYFLREGNNVKSKIDLNNYFSRT